MRKHNQYPATHRSPGSEHRSPTGVVVQRSLTPQRIETFLAELKSHGNIAEAARVASPDSNSPYGAKSAFYSRRKVDREFRRKWDEALELADSRLEVESVRRATVGQKRFEIQKGQVVRHPTTGEPLEYCEYSDRLLEVLLRSRIPRYQDRRKLEVEHSLAADSVAFLKLEDLEALNDADKRSLARILQKIQAARGENDALDAEFSEVEALPAPTDEPMALLTPAERAELKAITS